MGLNARTKATVRKAAGDVYAATLDDKVRALVACAVVGGGGCWLHRAVSAQCSSVKLSTPPKRLNLHR